MKQDFSTYRITLLLYIGVLLIPFGFFYTYSNVKNSVTDTSIIRKLGKIGTEMLIFTDPAAIKNNTRSIQKIDSNFKEIESWVEKNKESEFYVGGRTLQADFNQLKQCWQQLKKDPKKENAFMCLKTENSLSFTIDKMYTLKQKKIKNMFYINIIGTLIFMLLLIYFVRSYIHHQLKKHAIHDYDTQLFNKKYFLAELHTTTERAKRYDKPLSLCFISLDNLAGGNYNKKTKQEIIKKFAEILSSVARNSDIVSRYEEDQFAILMALTERNNALRFEERLKEALKSYPIDTTPKIKISFSTIQFDNNETDTSFIKRAQSMLE